MPIDLNLAKPHYSLFIISMTCDGSCNTVEDLFCRIYVPNKMEGMNLKVSNMIKGITNELKTLTKCISCKCKCEFVGKKQKWDKNGTMVSINVILNNQ